ncbi:MAG: hypothetical protein ACOXZ4_06620 [Sphaerochaetaceae bacterium]
MEKTAINMKLLGYVAAGLLGFFFQGAIPLGYQYASELSYPVQEASSQAALLMNGHLLAVLLLLFMNLQGGLFLEHVLIVSVALLAAGSFGILFLKESPIIITEDERLQAAVDKEAVHRS